MKNLYNEDYFKRGIETGKSLYTNYRWLPELTIPMIARLIMDVGIKQSDKILDYGCAFGYSVKAFRLLGFDAWGCDTSQYAIDNCDPDVKDYVFKINDNEHLPQHYDWIIAKDVLEHISYGIINETLRFLRANTYKMFCAIPLGKNGKYNCPAYELDTTHVIKEPLAWWILKFKRALFAVPKSYYELDYMKQNWSKWPKGNGFFVLSLYYGEKF